MDVFVEQFVIRKKKKLERISCIVIWIVAILIFLFAITFGGAFGDFSMIFYICGMGALVGGWYFSSRFKVEYEYSLVNGEIDFDKVIAERSRKRIASINLANASSFGKFSLQEHPKSSYKTRISLCDTMENLERVYYIAYDDAKLGHTLIAFTPHQKLLEAIQKYIKLS